MADNDDKPERVISGTEDTVAPEEAPSDESRRPRLLLAGDRLGRYRLEEELGEGGMATVFRATDLELRREVAIKVLFAHLAKRSEIVARFQREARAVAALDHEHILEVYDVGGGDGEPPYLVLELVKGQSLDELVDGTLMPAEIAAAIGVDLCSALECAHEAGIIHRDIKPANILVAEGGRVVVADFGVAHAEGDSLVTRTGAMLGTPAFMSPEQALGSDLTGLSDLYSVGATLYRLATGALPYSGTTARIVSSILQGSRESAQRLRPAVGPDFSAVVEKLVATDPSDRYASAGEARAALAELVATVADEPDELLARYFEDPDGCSQDVEARAVRHALSEGARAAASGNSPRALALANRVLELDGNNREALALVERASRQPRRWGLWALVVLLLFGLVGGSYALLARDSSRVAGAVSVADASVPDPSVVTAAVADAASPADAPPPADASPGRRDAGRRPETSARNAGSRTVPATKPDAGRVASPEPADAAPVAIARPQPVATGTVVVVTDTWCDLRIDGEDKGRHNPNAQRRYELDVGRRRLVCTQGPGRLSKETAVNVVAGKSQSIRMGLIEPVRVSVRLSKGAMIVVGGKRVGNGQNVALQPGRHSITVLNGGGQSIGSKRVTVPAGKPCVLRDMPSLGCFAQ